MSIPVIHITHENLPGAWEESIIRTWEEGALIPTQYDSPDDPPSRDCTMVMVVEDPFAEPRYHRGLIGGIDDLTVYVEEVCSGLHDDWVEPDKDNPKWRYGYYERLNHYSVPGQEPVDQLQYVVDTLAGCPYSRRAQATIWKPWFDAGDEHAPCLQRMQFRLIGNELLMNVHMRSNDAMRASLMNIIAFTELQKIIAKRVTEKIGYIVKPGQYVHCADSYHIYGSCYKQVEDFISLCDKRSFADRTYRTEDVQWIIDETLEKINRKDSE